MTTGLSPFVSPTLSKFAQLVALLEVHAHPLHRTLQASLYPVCHQAAGVQLQQSHVAISSLRAKFR